MKVLVQITHSIESYLNNIAAAYKRIALKGQLPQDLQTEFKRCLLRMAELTDMIRTHADKLPEPTNTPPDRPSSLLNIGHEDDEQGGIG